jgi:hypothetical protein
MQSRDPHEEKIASATSSAYPQSGQQVPPIPPPQYSASTHPYPQPVGGANPYPQPYGGVYPTTPVLQEPISARHNTDTTILIQPAQTVLPTTPREWSTGLFDCFQDSEICKLGIGKGKG